MAEALNSLYKGELIDCHTWSGLIDVMAATAEWIGWYNNRRLHSGIEYRPPIEVHHHGLANDLSEATAA